MRHVRVRMRVRVPVYAATEHIDVYARHDTLECVTYVIHSFCVYDLVTGTMY